MLNHIVIFGATGAIGHACFEHLCAQYPNAKITGIGRKDIHPNPHLPYISCDLTEESHLIELTKTFTEPIDLIIIAIGMLHNDTMMPEKSIHDLNIDKFNQQFLSNAIIPSMIAKHFLPKLSPEGKMGILSARVGSINDNVLGGWYSYRASKAALNMVIKNLAIECKRTKPQQTIIGLHPGTVDSKLSKPFQQHLDHTLFDALTASQHLVQILEQVTPERSGQVIAWDGKTISP